MNYQNQKQYKTIIENIDIQTTGTILDIGFGNGYLLRRLAKQNLFVLLQEKVKIHKADIGVNDYGRKIRKNMVG